MKRIGNIYHLVYDIDNLKTAILRASNRKRNRREVKQVLADIDGHALILQDMLINKNYEPTPYKTKLIFNHSNQKYREVCMPAFFPDLCIQWALMLVLEPVLMKGMYKYSCGCIPDRGNLYGKKKVEKWVRNDKKHTKYCLTMDIDKFFPSVNLGVLKNKFRTKIKDSNILWLIDTIIDVNDKGLPMGFYTSTWFANFLLQDLDHIIKEKLGAKYYIRNMDDLEIFGNNKKKLHKALKFIMSYLKNIGLKLNGNWQVFKYQCNRVLDFLGYRFYRNYTLVRKRIALRFRRVLNKAKRRLNKSKKPTYKQSASIISYLGWTKHGNCYNFYQVNIKPYFNNLNIIKGVIRNEQKRKYTASIKIQFNC